MKKIDFMTNFLNEASCKAAWKKYRKPGGVVCPHYGSTAHYWETDKECCECGGVVTDRA